MRKFIDVLLTIIRLLAVIGWFVLVLFVSINFLDKTNELYRLFFIYSLLIAFLFWNRLKVNLELLVLFIFSTSYYFIFIDYYSYTEWTYMRLWVGAPIMYFGGLAFISKKTYPLINYALLMIPIGYFIYGSLNMYNYLKDEVPIGTRVAYDFWGQHAIGATLMSAYFIGIGALLFYVFFTKFDIKGIIIKLFILLGVGWSVYLNIVLANRTFFIISGLVLLLMLLAHVFLIPKKGIKILAITIVIVLISTLIYRYDVIGIRSWIEATRWFIRINNTIESGLLNDPRFKVYGLVWKQIFDYRLGGFQMDIGGLTHAHNLWMDVLYTAGVYPFFLLLGFTFLTITSLFKLLMIKSIPYTTKIIVVSLFLGYNMYFMVEPILDGVPYVFSFYCLINGLTYKYIEITQSLYPRKQRIK